MTLFSGPGPLPPGLCFWGKRRGVSHPPGPKAALPPWDIFEQKMKKRSAREQRAEHSAREDMHMQMRHLLHAIGPGVGDQAVTVGPYHQRDG